MKSWPAAAAALALLAACVIAGPWGEFPLNDDWQYAHVAKQFGETGRFDIDVSVLPALVGQTLLAFPALKLFGFSHLTLRLLTLLLACASLFALDRILRDADVAPRLRLFALLLLAVDPLWFYFSTTFMTEIYGTFFAALAAALWFADRRRRDRASDAAAISWFAALSAALLCGAAYWTRQIFALAFFALLLSASILPRARLRRTLPRLAGAAGLFAASVAAYFAWARATGNYRPEQTHIFDLLFQINDKSWFLHPIICLVYLTFLLLPLLLLAQPRLTFAALLAAILLVGLALIGQHQMQRIGWDDFGVSSPLHKRFPYFSNVIFNAGLGPITLTEMWYTGLPSPLRWPTGVLTAIELPLLAGTVLWVFAGAAFGRALRERRAAAEVATFGVVFALLTFLASVWIAHGWGFFDRYYFPSLLGLWIALAAVLGGNVAPGRPRKMLAALGLAALGAFAIGGVHDEFRWNEARWKLLGDALAAGVPPHRLEGGYEYDGWMGHELTHHQARCEGRCFCVINAWGCVDDTDRVGMVLMRGYRIVEAVQPRYWLADGPPLIWSRR